MMTLALEDESNTNFTTELLSEIPGYAVDDVDQSENYIITISNETENSLQPIAPLVVTEPNDSPFRVRRISRSFSISSVPFFNTTRNENEELFCSSKQAESSKSKKSDNSDNSDNFDNSTSKSKNEISKFILIRRSRSLGQIFLPDIFNTKNNFLPEASGLFSENSFKIENLTEKVEALEIEVLDNEAKFITSQAQDFIETYPKIERPQTSPPVLFPSKSSVSGNGNGNVNKSKLSLLDRMQKSLGIFFKCARRDERHCDDQDDLNGNYRLRNVSMDMKMQFKLPIQSENLINNKNINVIIPKYQKSQSHSQSQSQSHSQSQSQPQSQSIKCKMKIPVPLQKIKCDANSFVTKIDESEDQSSDNSIKRVDIIKKLPQYYDVSRLKGSLLAPISPRNFGKKCLVLDLDETLVHSSFYVPEVHDLVVCLGLPDGTQQNIYVAKRPGVDQFLAEVNKMFEVVIFTASLAHYADPVIDFLCDGMYKAGGLRESTTDKGIDNRLYRESCLFLRGLYVKDLSRLGRDLEQTVIVDNSPASFLLHPEQGIAIKSWFNDCKDKELSGLMESLRRLAEAESVSRWRSDLSEAPQNEYVEESIKRKGRRMDHSERQRKKEARAPRVLSKKAQETRGLKAKILNRRRHVEKIEMKKKLRIHDQKMAKDGGETGENTSNDGAALPPYLMDRAEPNRSKVLSNLVKEKRKEKAGKWSVPLPQVKGLAQDEIFKVMKSGKRQKKCWKRMITKATFVGEGFTRNPPKMERFIRPAALRMKKCNVTHPELKTTFQLPIISVKKNPQGPMYSQLGVLTKGTIIEVNVSELGLVTTGGKVVWGKYAQITNNPENDGCINSVLLV